MWQSVEKSERFQCFNFKTDFCKTKTFFKKLEYSFLVGSIKFENVAFPYKTALSEANVKTNKTYHKERSFTVTTWYFLKI